MPVPPPNAFQPGTNLEVGTHKISIIQYISEGGFAHVYTCKVDPPFRGSSIACLKRVVVPSKWQLSLLRQEVDAMRRLRGNKHIVSYIDSHAARLSKSENDTTQKYEVFLLMEYCENKGLIDFMNTRLVNKLTEPEIIDIMYQVTLGVAMCHHLRPPLIHRDIKIENVLIDGRGTFKLCDFGSSVPYQPPPKSPQELQLLQDELQQHTTPQYRAPEMIDLSKGFPIDDKSDIWALGVFLYKLCYYTTPFENPNQTSLSDLENTILNCGETLKFRDAPGSMFSHRMKNIIKVCLRGDPRRRPNAVQLLGEICAIKGIPIPDVIPYSVHEQLKAETVAQVPKVAPVLTPTNLNKVSAVPAKKSEVNNASKPVDPFALDKTEMLNKLTHQKIVQEAPPPRPRSRTNSRPPARPLSAFYSEESSNKVYTLGNKSTPTIQDHVKSEITRQHTYDYEPNGTLEFLKTKERERKGENKLDSVRRVSENALGAFGDAAGSIGSSAFAAVDYGNQLVKTLSNDLVKTLTGETTGDRKSKSKRLSVGNGTSTRKSLEQDWKPEPVKKLSIQKRVQMLFNDSPKPTKSASGYGRFTDGNVGEDLDAINVPSDTIKMTKSPSKKALSPPKIPLGLSSHRLDDKPVNKKKPPKPKKPGYLKTSKEDSDDNYDEDIEVLQKQFAKRFPSYV
ncbi:Actin-regulating kinase PRK1 [Spathaspora sp. JA1]|nr:Actin-regulating kinase PRK1 [Spathaspora sp. JA1]